MLRQLHHRYFGKSWGKKNKGVRRKSSSSTLAIETLENRLVPAVFNVNSLADVLNPPTGAVTLRSAIQAANATPGDDTINLTLAGTYQITLAGSGEDANATGDFDILASGGNLTIVNTSKGTAIVDGGGHDRIFDINPTFDANNPNATAPFKVTLQGLTLQHGIAAPFGDGTMGGGAIRDTGNASLELDNCIVTNNAASGAGGGILMQNTINTPWTLTLNNTLISNNHAGDAGGGVDTIGSGKVNVTGSQFVQNTCVNQGAAIWLDTIGGASATLNFSSSLVSRNDAFAGPTGALGTAGNGAITISSSTISDNYSGSTGGGFGDENMTANVTISNSQFLNNVAVTDGGGVQAGGTGTTTTITNTVFAGNTAGGNGGGFFASGGAAAVTNTRFTENTATGGGGIEDQAATFALSFSELDNNAAVGDANGNGGNGGGFFVNSDITSATVANSLFLNNRAANGPASQGGAFYQITGTLGISNSQFTGNLSTGSAGALLFGGSVLTLTTSTFNANHADGGIGGAVFLSANSFMGTSTLTNDTFFANNARGVGGAVEAETSGPTTFLNDTVVGNTSINGVGGLDLVPNGNNVTHVFQNTIVAGNVGPGNLDINSYGVAVLDHGGNFIGTLTGVTGFGAGTLTGNPKLGPLQNNGGPLAGVPGFGQVVQTEALLPGSPAIGKGVAAGAPTKDERGFPRPAATLSIGAYEPQYAPNASANQILVENFFEVLLNRLTDSGSAGFVNELNNGVSAGTVVLQIEGSSEYLGNQVQALFQRYLHRQADATGLPSFINLLSHGGTLEQAAAIIVGSPEYFQLHGGNNVSFLKAMYLDALGRLPDAFGQDSFTQMLAGGASRTTVALAVFTSPEYRSNLIAQGFSTLLGRQAFPEDLTNFSNAFQNGLTDQVFVAILLGSTEFRNDRT